MGGMMGGKKGTGGALAGQNTKLHAIRVQTSALGQAIPLIFGAQRAAYRLIDYTDFLAHAVTSGGKKSGGGGKKGGGSSQQYTYTATPVALLCAGGSTGIQGIHSLWDTQGKLAILNSTQVNSVPSGGGVVAVTPPSSGVFLQDTGLSYDAAYSVVVNDFGSDGPVTLSGTQQIPLVYTTSPTPGVGEYTVNSTTGVYTVGASPTGGSITVSINYAYTIPNSQGQGSATETLNLTLFTGTRVQSPWPFMTTNHPTHAFNYRGVAYLGAPNEDLGASGALPNFTFEVYGLLPYGGGEKSSEPSALIKFILDDPFEGVGFNPSWVDALTNYQASCVANDLFLSPIYDAQVEAGKAIDDICDMTNAAVVFTQGKLKVRSYFDTSAVGRGKTFNPETQPIYDLGLDDYISDGTNPPIQVTRSSVANASNSITIEFLNASSSYNPEPAEAKDQGHIETYGLRKANPEPMHAVTSSTRAKKIADFKLKREVYIRAKYTFKLGMQYILLEPMDLVTLTEPELGYNKLPVRIKKITEDSEKILTIEAEEFPWGTSQGTLYPHEPADGFIHSGLADPGNVNTPVILEANTRLSESGGYEVWLALSGNSDDWGGCGIWTSPTIAGTYTRVDEQRGKATQGVLLSTFPTHTDPDSSDTLSVDLSQSKGTLPTATADDANNFRTLCYVDGELVSYQTSTLTGANQYSLGTLIRRGVFNFPISAHVAGSLFARLDDLVFILTLDPTTVGKNLFLKFTSFNTSHAMEQDISNVTPYSIFVSGYGGGFQLIGNNCRLDSVDGGSSASIRAYKVTQILPTAQSGAVRLSNVVTLKTTIAHGRTTGDNVVVGSVTTSSFNGSFSGITVDSPTQLHYTQTGANETSGEGAVGNISDDAWATRMDGTIVNIPHSIFTGKSYGKIYWVTINPTTLAFSFYTTYTDATLAVGNGDVGVGSVKTVIGGGTGGLGGGGGDFGGGGGGTGGGGGINPQPTA